MRKKRILFTDEICKNYCKLLNQISYDFNMGTNQSYFEISNKFRENEFPFYSLLSRILIKHNHIECAGNGVYYFKNMPIDWVKMKNLFIETQKFSNEKQKKYRKKNVIESNEKIKKITWELPNDIEKLEKDMQKAYISGLTDLELVSELRERGYEVKCTKSIEL